MHVGDLAKRTGASIRSLHYYEQMGVLHATRQENGYRSYDQSAIEQVRRVRLLLALGFSLSDIRLLAPCLAQQETGATLCNAAIIHYQQKITDIDQRIRLLQELRAGIEQRLQTAQVSQIKENFHDS
jgi:Predicted transcriptional regulators